MYGALRRHRTRGVFLPSRHGQFFTFVLCTLVMTSVPSHADESRTEPEINLTLSQTAFTTAEKLLATVEFINRSPDMIILNRAYNVFGDCTLTFHIVSPSGQKLRQKEWLYGRRPLNYNSGDFERIRSHRSYRGEFDLAQWFTLDELGLYKVEVEYVNRFSEKQFGKQVWTGQIKSSARTFQLTR